MPTLFDPLQLGDLSLPNRIIMAPLTRCRAEPGRVPGELIVEYYRQRASAGLIISEATAVTPMGVGYPDTPGIWSDAQIEGWKKVTAAVHEAGGRIMLQLWHVGRISDPLYLDDALPVAPSAIQPAGTVSLVRPKKAYVTPRALDTEEIPGIIDAYRKGAANAWAAGFDGVEIHAANGYLIDQFLQSSTNRRTDAYGGPVEHRARLLLEITDAILETWAPGRVGVHLSPRGDAHDMGDDRPRETFGYVAEALGRRGIAFLCLREHEGEDSLAPMMRDMDAAIASLSDLRDKPSGTISITTVEHAAKIVLLPAMDRLLPDHPDITVEITIDYGMADIVADRFDAGVRLGGEIAKDMIAVRISADVPMAIVGAPSYFEAHGRPSSPSELVEHRAINLRLPSSGTLNGWRLAVGKRETRVRIDGPLILNTIDLIRDAALAGHGLAYLPLDQIKDHLGDGRLERVLSRATPDLPGYHLYYPSRRFASPAFKLFVDALRYRDG